MTMIKGITVTLYETTPNGVDGFGAPVYSETAVTVDNVLVAPASSEDIITNTDLTGKKEVYTLAIPKGDTHDWVDKRVDFWGKSFKTFGFPVKGIDALVPTSWNMKVTVERYE